MATNFLLTLALPQKRTIILYYAPSNKDAKVSVLEASQQARKETIRLLQER